MQLSPKSRLLSLNPFLDEGVRLQSSQLDFDAKHPMILPKFHRVTSAIINHFHRKFDHAGAQSLLAATAEVLAYWRTKNRFCCHQQVHSMLQIKAQTSRAHHGAALRGSCSVETPICNR